MNPSKHNPARRWWIREFTVGVAAGVGSDLVRTLMHVAMRLFG